MTYLHTPAESPLYAKLEADLGYVPNYGRPFALGPDAFAAWLELNGSVKAGMDLRRYELVTLAAARRMGSRSCSLAHAAVLQEQFYDEATLKAIVADRHNAGLDPADIAAMDFAERIAVDPTAATEADMAELRAAGLSDVDIFHVVLAVCARRFFAGVLDAVGVVPDARYDALDPALAP